MIAQDEALKNALRDTEQRYRALLENSCEGITLLDEKGTILYVSSADERIMGRRPEESIGTSAFDWVDPDNIGVAAEAFSKLLQQPGETLRVEILVRHKDGGSRWMECAAKNLLNNPAVRGIVLNYHDITDRKIKEEEARTHRERFEIISGATHDVVWDWDISGNRLWWNGEFYSRYGYQRDIPESIEFWWNSIDPKDLERVKQTLDAALQGNDASWSSEYRFRHADGRVSDVWDRGFIMRDTNGKAIRMLGTMMDITERKNAEMRVEKLAAFVRYNPNPAFEISSKGEVSFSNEAANAVAKRLCRDRVEEILPAGFSVLARNTLETGTPQTDLISAIKERTYSWSLIPVPSCNVVHCCGLDITDRIKLEEQLRQVSKMEAIGQLAGGVAHDFNNLLTVIEGHATLLSLSEELKESASRESIREISLAAERAANLTRQLLTFSRKQVMQARSLDCNEVVSNVTRMLQRLLGEDVELCMNFAPALPRVHADPGMLEQVLVNVAVNARDAMPAGGHLLIETSLQQVDAKYVSANPEAALGPAVRISVTDTGCGIAPDDLPRIFEPFFTTKEVGKGTGLGLATVYGIIKQHKGWIKVLSTVGKGTTFEICLPATKAVTPAPKVKKPKPQGGTETILLVEDEVPVRQLTRTVLEMYGYKVIEAPTGREAWNLWQQHRNNIDLVLTDMVMPDGMSGRELVRKIQSDKAQAKAIYVSGYSADFCEKDFGGEKINFLQKPFHPEELGNAIRKCLDQSGVEVQDN